MGRIDVAGFERKFRAEIDPWDYRVSRFERYKRKLLIQACGCAKRGRGLELGCANGETTRELAPLCLTLVALDGSPTALAEAGRRTGNLPNITFLQAALPQEMPPGPFDLIVVSEIAYYLAPHALASLARRLARALASGGRIVVLNHRRLFSDAAQYPAAAHQKLCRTLRRSMSAIVGKAYPHFDIATFEQRLGRPHGGP